MLSPAHLAQAPPSSGKDLSRPEVLEFVDWLESCLDALGLDANLYGRCVMSILRQPAEQLSEEVLENESELPGSPMAASVMSRKDSLGYISTDTSFVSVSSGGGAMGSLGKVGGGHKLAPSHAQKAALFECLRSVDLEQKRLEEFVAEILSHFEPVKPILAKLAGEEAADAGFWELGAVQQNDSVDSGVCPSPVDEHNQNYDEAFPPLSETDSTTAKDDGPGSGGDGESPRKDVAAPPPTPHPSEDDVVVEAVPSTGARAALSQSCPPPQDVLQPFAQQNAVNTATNAPSFNWEGPTAGLFTFSTPKVRAPGGGGGGASGRQTSAPQFVVPKVRNVSGRLPSGFADSKTKVVSSCPTRLEFGFSGPPVATARKDLSCYLCSLVGTGCAEHGGGEERTEQDGSDALLLPPPPPPLPPSEPDNIEILDTMFDAPRFILHIINEQQQQQAEKGGRREEEQGEGRQPPPRPPSPFLFPAARLPADDWEERGQHQNHHQQTVIPPFSWSPKKNWIQQPPPPPPGLLMRESWEEDFRLPKLPSDLLGGATEERHAPPPPADLKELLAVPVRADTHFVPIKSESMEEAFVPRPRAPEEGPYATDVYENEEYFILRRASHHAPLPQHRNDTSYGHGGTEEEEEEPPPSPLFPKAHQPAAPQHQHPAPFFPPPPPTAALAPPQQTASSLGGVTSLPLKFKAGRPAKECQATLEAEEEEEEDLLLFGGASPPPPTTTTTALPAHPPPRYGGRLYERGAPAKDAACWQEGPGELLSPLGAAPSGGGEPAAAMPPVCGDPIWGAPTGFWPWPTSGASSSSRGGFPVAGGRTGYGESLVGGADGAVLNGSRDEDDLLLRYVGNISLIAPLEIPPPN